MNYLSVENLHKTWHDKPVLAGITFGISQGEKVALVAGNGQGKSTLLSIICGQEQPDSGKAIVRKEIRMGYLPQEPVLNDGATVLDNVLQQQTPVTRAVAAYEKAVERQEHDHSEASMDALQKATEAMNNLGAWDYEHRVKQILTQLKITDFDQTAGSLSGGQRKRVALARILLSEPDLLILDEPTNHLDLEMIEWLEGYLTQRDLTLFLVTHDRYFLDRVCDRIVELDGGQIYHYKGNYSYFVENKAQREANAASEAEKDRNLYRRELEWVRRMPKARGTKSKSRTEAFDELDEKLRNRKQKNELQINMRMERMGAKILELHHIKKSYGDRKILSDFNYVFKRGEKIGIVGPNGVGKTTLLNMIMGIEAPDGGKIVTGDTMIFGYYSQQGMQVDDSKKVIDVVRDVADWIPMANGNKLTASQLLLRFGFSHDKQWDFVAKLSGGEKRRLFLMSILMKAPNFLILDEPTNDLDIETLGVLEDFLQEYEGCALIVSHDRYFMDKVVDHCFVFNGDGTVKDFPGNYSEYREWADLQETIPEKPGKTEAMPTPAAQPAQEKRKLSFKEKYELEQLEKELPALEKRKAEIEKEMAEKFDDYNLILQLTAELEHVKNTLDEKGMRWLELGE
ncbi:MAG: ABC-F family ATP-binding cassette domain-containing protein [Bacteroidetes bacterium]|nr:ABC-F family ATP-binding cassette domain-containing protein [Bacteroidota bacterium]